jgi:hypothetical protein
VRLDDNGSIDSTFRAGTPDGAVFAVGVQSQGKIVVGGSFTELNGVGLNRFARLLPNGEIDSSFGAATGANGTVYTLVILPDDNVLIGGDFTVVNQLPRAGVARLLGADSALQFTGISVVPGAPVTLTFVTSPGRTYTVETSTDLINWTSLGNYTATGTTLEVTDSDSGSFDQRFYRVREVGP